MIEKPLIGVPADMVHGEERPYHRVYDKYLDVILWLDALPILIPAIGLKTDPAAYVAKLDGILIPGSRSNVAPALYGRTQEMSDPVDNPERDATTLPLIRAAIAHGVPIFAICRGIQELNVALGGTLHQQVDKLPDRHVHQFADCSIDELFAPSHEVSATLGSRLYALTGEHRITINSAHNQAIDDLAPGLAVEAKADDGTIEGVRLEGAKAMTYGVQWHPEYGFQANPVSQALFQAFGDAARERASKGRG